MEGIGSTRLGRVSSRYNSGSVPVFDGPVRKWKKQWVLYQSDNNNNAAAAAAAKGKGNNHRRRQQPPILLCRWTPLPSSTTTTTSDDNKPPKRKFRYTPIIVLEEKKKEALEKVGYEAEANVTVRREMTFKKPHFSDAFMEEIKELSEDEAYFNGYQLDLQL